MCPLRFSTHKDFTPGPGQYDVSAAATAGKKGGNTNSSRCDFGRETNLTFR